MGHNYDGASELVTQPAESTQYELLIGGVELGGWLVGKDQRRLARGGGRDRDALLLTSGQGARPLAFAALQVKRVECAVDRVAKTALPAGKAQPEHHVLACAQLGPQVPVLEDDRDVTRPMLGELGLAQAGERAAEHSDLAGGGLIEGGG